MFNNKREKRGSTTHNEACAKTTTCTKRRVKKDGRRILSPQWHRSTLLVISFSEMNVSSPSRICNNKKKTGFVAYSLCACVCYMQKCATFILIQKYDFPRAFCESE
jgi:hypothetical protein